MIEKAKTQKQSARRGKPIGMKSRAQVSLHINDDDRNVSRLWEIVKSHYSGKRQTAGETARRVFLRGLAAEIQEIELENSRLQKEVDEKNQLRLF